MFFARNLKLSPGPVYKVNDETVQGQRRLAAELDRIFSIRVEKTVFVQGDPRLDFASIAAVIDASHTAGIDHVGILTPAMAAN